LLKEKARDASQRFCLGYESFQADRKDLDEKGNARKNALIKESFTGNPLDLWQMNRELPGRVSFFDKPFLLPSFFLIRFLKNIIVLVNQVFSLVEGTIGMHVIRKNAGKSDSIQR
jgi:hypothetical protein